MIEHPYSELKAFYPSPCGKFVILDYVDVHAFDVIWMNEDAKGGRFLTSVYTNYKYIFVKFEGFSSFIAFNKDKGKMALIKIKCGDVDNRWTTVTYLSQQVLQRKLTMADMGFNSPAEKDFFYYMKKHETLKPIVMNSTTQMVVFLKRCTWKHLQHIISIKHLHKKWEIQISTLKKSFFPSFCYDEALDLLYIVSLTSCSRKEFFDKEDVVVGKNKQTCSMRQVVET